MDELTEICSNVAGQAYQEGIKEGKRLENARLIAAEPDLLEALKECLNAMENGDPNEETTKYLWHDIIIKGNKAINKALGIKE